MLGDQRTSQLRQLAAEVLSRARTGRLFANDHLVHVAEQLAYGFSMLSCDQTDTPPAAASPPTPDNYADAVKTLLRSIADAVDDFFAVAAAEYLEDASPGVRLDVQVAARAAADYRRKLAPNLRLAAGDHDEKYHRVYLLDAITTVIKDKDNPSVEDFADQITFSTGILDQRTEAEIDAELEQLALRFHKIKHKDQPQ